MAKVSLRAYNREIETMIDRGQFDEAIAHCRHILKTYPKHLETYRLLGKAYLESKRYGDAVDLFSRILAAVPNDFVAQVGMSIIRDEENNLDDAIWHMERAFETQPSNPAIQGELQRLYGRRDGVKPPRIRMTRGALANMYVQGELYPQAISEINNVLKDDPDRADMQALLARAYYKNGLKNDAADVASSLLRRYPYTLDANRVLVEILGSEHPESAQAYRQRVYELDPYAAHVAGNIFLSNEVSDAAVNIERLDWNGQPVTLPSDWSDSKAVSLETGGQPEWLDRPLDEPSNFGGVQSPSSLFESAPAAPNEPAAFGSILSSSQPEEEIPDFLREAGWGAATGAFDESRSAFAEEDSKPAESIEQGDLPDWVKAMKPPETQTPATQDEEEEIPDWIKNIGMGAIASQAFDRNEQPAEEPTTEPEETTQWLSALEGTPEAASSEDRSGEFAWLKNLDDTDAGPAETKSDDMDWLKSLDAPQESTGFASGEPDWLKGLGTPEQETPSVSEEPDWLKGLGTPEAQKPFSAETEEPDWLKGLGEPEGETPPTAAADEPDWLKGLGEPQTAQAESQTDDLDWLKNLGAPEEVAPSITDEEPDWLKGLGEPEAMPSSTREDETDWMKGLATAGGIGALSHMEQENEPEEKAEAATSPEEVDSNFLNQLSEEPILETPSESTPSNMDLDQLGTSEQERDDSFAWLESLAAKQGATEGLLTKPEERLEEEPDWVKQAKGLKSETPVSQTPTSQPPASLEDLGKSEQDQDDSFAWLESLAAKQGATEGLLTKPEERLEEEPDWVKQAKDLNAQDKQTVTAPQMEPEVPLAAVEPEPTAETEQPAPVDEVEAWLRNLEGEETTPETQPAADETAIWLKGLDERQAPSVEEPVEKEGMADLPDWMKNIQEDTEEKSAVIFEEEAELGSTWMPPTEEPAPVPESKAEDALPSWLSELDEDKEQVATPSNADDLPSWLLAEDTAPGIPERTIFSDWKPAEEAGEEPVAEQEPELEQPEPTPLPAAPFEMAEAETVLEPEQPQTEAEPAPVMESPTPVPALSREPVSPRETGGLIIPTVDPVLGIARNEMSRNNLSNALDSYGKLIKKARFLDEVIYDLREASYRYPVDVNLWQSLGDAYMRANRLQDALDAYTKAEELLR